MPYYGDWEAVIAAVREFVEPICLGSARPYDSVLATVLFTDLVGSTAKAVEVGDRRWRELLEQHNARIRTELTRFRGIELDTAGDGFFARFDGPARAIRCACAVRAAVRDLGLEVRAGVHTGECEIVDGKVAGVAVSIGARVAAQAGPGDVLVSQTVKDLVAGSESSSTTEAERSSRESPVSGACTPSAQITSKSSSPELRCRSFL